MIEKININNFGIFKNFEWDKNVKDGNNNPLKFKDINIIYGRNYSGKTTLSKIIRALETKNIPDKYENPQFEIIFNNATFSESNYQNHSYTIRVYNEDFVKDNLSFIYNQDEKINAFAILGNNSKIEKEIKKLEERLGNKEKNIGMFKELEELESSKKEKFKEYNKLKKDLENQKKIKAIDKKQGIKYKAYLFGDQNYNTSKLDREIEEVLKDSYISITEDKKNELEKLIKETALNTIPETRKIELNLENLSKKTKEILEKKIIGSEKIEELVNDYVLNRWADEGYKLHKDKKLKTCAFCANEIKDDRWKKLEKHFDKETEQLKKDIENLLKNIDNEKEKIQNAFNINKKLFYSKFHKDLEKLEQEYNTVSKNYLEVLEKLKEKLDKRQKNIIHIQKFEEIEFDKKTFENIFEQYNNIIKQSNSFSEILEQEQQEAYKKLRLFEVYNFINLINYKKKIEDIKLKGDEYKKADENHKKIEEEIQNIVQQINNKKQQLKNEGEGAKKVNIYLNDFLGHQKLHLKPVDEVDEITKNKQIKFEIFRDDKKAYNLSEGEKSLISFCYFLAKLNDVETKDTKPIIFIDDPISSLDGNHIFFIHSLLNSEVVHKNIFTQLFISTHNLNFLKYLKRLKGKNGNRDYQKNYFVLQKDFNGSTLENMPKYLKEYVTEFNYLFKQLYDCSKLEKVDDKNYSVYYNFGNNARKFLEIFLFYKYPDFNNIDEKYEKFFDSKIPSLFSSRINNEYSHLVGVVERGETPIEVPEMNKVAKLILKRIKELDLEQYKSLLKSIGIEYDSSSN